MAQIEETKIFSFSTQPKKPDMNNYEIIALFGENVICNWEKNGIFFPKKDYLTDITKDYLYLGILEDKEIYTINLDSSITSKYTSLHSVKIKSILDQLTSAYRHACYRALHLAHWHKTTNYCGCCGNETLCSQKEFVKICTHCTHKQYPQHSPVVIVRITHGDKILLGRSPHFRENMYSTLAGFIEAGETPEKAIEREIFEEVGIHVKNIKYHSSQSWPFPNNIMLAYTAEYKSGTLNIDNDELEDAAWFSADKMPILPIKASIAHTLITEFSEKHINTSLSYKKARRKLLVILPILPNLDSFNNIINSLNFLHNDYEIELEDPLEEIKISKTRKIFYQAYSEKLAKMADNYHAILGFSFGGVIIQQSLEKLKHYKKPIILFSVPSYVNNVLHQQLTTLIRQLHSKEYKQAFQTLNQYVSYPYTIPDENRITLPMNTARFEKVRIALEFLIETDSRTLIQESNLSVYHFIGELSQLINQSNVTSSKIEQVKNAGMRVLEDNPDYCRSKILELLTCA